MSRAFNQDQSSSGETRTLFWLIFLGVVFLAVSVLVVIPLFAVEEGAYFKPAMEGYVIHNEYDDDGDGDGVNETKIRKYINKDGNTVFSMTTNDRLWAWSLDTKGDDDSDTGKNYVIRDSNCDGMFDERYGMKEEFHVPECAKDPAVSKSPALL